MNIDYGTGKTEYGTGVQIELTGKEAALAILSYLVARDVHISGPRTIRINDELIDRCSVFVDPSGKVTADGEGFSGRGPERVDATLRKKEASK